MEPIATIRAFPDDCLPPEGDHKSREALLVAINEWAKPRGYAFVTGRSRRTASGRQVVHYACDRYRATVPTATKRASTTRSTGCQFSITARESLQGGTWTLRHREGSLYCVHNHEPSLSPTAHPAHRRLSMQDVGLINRLGNAGIRTRDIRTFMYNDNPESLATTKDYNNALARGRREMAGGWSNMLALSQQLRDSGFWSKIEVDDNNRMTSAIFAHPASLEYLRAYPDVMLMDCIYKTNMFNMPLLDIIGIDARGKSFCVGFAFLSHEEEADYTWALDQLHSVMEEKRIQPPTVILTDRSLPCMRAIRTCFPRAAHLLCGWHINKGITRHCMPEFISDSKDKDSQEA